jgi:hypothetical protein
MKVCVLAFLVTIGCGSAAKEESKVTGSPITAKSDLTGTWTLTSVGLQQNSGQAVTFSGSQARIFRENGTTFTSSTGVTLGFAGTFLLQGCTNYASGNWSITNGSLLYTSVYIGSTSGKCGDHPTVSVVANQDASLSASLLNGLLVLASPFTYTDESGNSQSDSVLFTYTRGAAETWTGTGQDPRFTGTFKIQSVYLNYVCTNSSKNFSGALGVSGSATLAVTGTSYTYSENNYIIGTAPACTGTSTGTLDIQSLEIDPSVASDSADCIKGDYSNAAPAGSANIVSRDIFTASNQWINLHSFSTAATNCVSQIISVAVKQ